MPLCRRCLPTGWQPRNRHWEVLIWLMPHIKWYLSTGGRRRRIKLKGRGEKEKEGRKKRMKERWFLPRPTSFHSYGSYFPAPIFSKLSRKGQKDGYICWVLLPLLLNTNLFFLVFHAYCSREIALTNHLWIPCFQSQRIFLDLKLEPLSSVLFPQYSCSLAHSSLSSSSVYSISGYFGGPS